MKRVATIGRQSPETHPCRSGLASFFPPPSSFLDGRRGGVSVDKNHLLSRSDLGRDSVIPSPWSVCRAGGKEQRRGEGIDFQNEGMRRIELRCGAETGLERNILLAGKQMSVAYSRGAVQFELQQVHLMLINCIVVFHYSPRLLLLFPPTPAQLSPEAS